MFFSHTIKSQTTFTENIISIMCCIHMHTILAIQLGRIHSSVHWIQLWNLLRNAGGPSVLPTTLLHATDCSRSLEVISWMQKVSFYGSSWIAIDDFLTCLPSNDSPFLHTHISELKSIKRLSHHKREPSRFNLCASRTFYFISSPLCFIHVHNCILNVVKKCFHIYFILYFISYISYHIFHIYLIFHIYFIQEAGLS